MRYLGSGPLGNFLSPLDGDLERGSFVVVGRRIRNFKRNDWRNIRKSRCIFLDTLDLNSISSASLLVKIKWALNPYRIEKSITYGVLKMCSPRLIRFHVPAISDSPAWLKISQIEGGIVTWGLTYETLVFVLRHIADHSENRYKAAEVFALCEKLDLNAETIRVKNCFSARIVNYAKNF